MTKYQLMSWNVNGIRAVAKKEVDATGTPFDYFLQNSGSDIICIQETKGHVRDLPKQITHIPGYFSYFAQATRKGYSGVAVYTRKEPESVQIGLGIPEFDEEGRTIIAEYEEFVLCTAYFPNGGASKERLAYKLRYYDAFLEYVTKRVKAGDQVVICGDVNTAHMERDLSRPIENQHRSGFLDIERAWIDRLVAAGFIDTLRMFTSDSGHYTWWDYKTRARERNVGWRIDYFFVCESLKDTVCSTSILTDITGSDHCPVTLELSF
ncbi:MAG: exodeoxyribonuclease III [Methanomicrobiales archaeon]|jgi:exodeoxyribonuclease-3|nr:exodeoxyribonuclease III [Methanomicrobiales archaeon]